MNAIRQVTVIFVLAMSLVISGCGPGQLFGPTITPTPVPFPSSGQLMISVPGHSETLNWETTEGSGCTVSYLGSISIGFTIARPAEPCTPDYIVNQLEDTKGKISVGTEDWVYEWIDEAIIKVRQAEQDAGDVIIPTPRPTPIVESIEKSVTGGSAVLSWETYADGGCYITVRFSGSGLHDFGRGGPNITCTHEYIASFIENFVKNESVIDYTDWELELIDEFIAELRR